MIDKRKAEVVAYAVAAFVLVLLAMRFLHRAPSADAGEKLSLAQPPDGAAAASRASAPNSGAGGSGVGGRPLVVDVAGEVRRPGVYRLPAGSRADLAVERAGGVTRRGERAAVNLAMPLRDGQQIVVPRRGAAAAAAAGAADSGAAGSAASQGSGASGGATPAQPISLSTATAAQLDSLDGIGPTLAARIIQYRDSHGGFRSVAELRQVEGIGEKRFAALSKALQP